MLERMGFKRVVNLSGGIGQVAHAAVVFLRHLRHRFVVVARRRECAALLIRDDELRADAQVVRTL